MSSATTEPSLFDAEAYRQKHGIRAYHRYVSGIENERNEWESKIIKENRQSKTDIKKVEGLEIEILLLKEQIAIQDKQLEELNTWRDQATVAEQRLQDFESSAKKCEYAVVLVDGDGYQFPDHLLREGFRGGMNAAAHLRSQTEVYLQGILGVDRLDTIVRVYVNLGDLYSIYRSAGVLNDINILQRFMSGFLQFHAFFEAIDVGQENKIVKHKLKENFNFYVRDTNCKHILIGCCHDEGYMTEVRRLWTTEKCSKISLIKHHRPEAEYRNTPFKVASLEGVFTETDAVSNSLKRSRSPSPALSGPFIQTTARAYFKVHLNRYGERIDIPLPYVNRQDLLAARRRQKSYVLEPCQIHYVFGAGSCTGRCEYDHEGFIQPNVILGLAFLGRDSACADGSKCRNEKCFRGHHCFFDPECKNGPTCKFFSTHGIDKRIFLPSEERDVEPSKRPRTSYNQSSSRGHSDLVRRPSDAYNRRW